MFTQIACLCEGNAVEDAAGADVAVQSCGLPIGDAAVEDAAVEDVAVQSCGLPIAVPTCVLQENKLQKSSSVNNYRQTSSNINSYMQTILC